jgi:NADP-dependent 3-hydroxy acid dehydrogenase YdfG
MELQDRTVVVTGASRGIGRAVALRLAFAGAHVVAGARDQADLDRLAAEHDNLRAHVLDVRDPASVDAFCAFARDPEPVDALVNNAGIGVFGPVEQLTVEDWDRVFEVNVRGTFLMTRALLPSIRSRRGHVVNVTSDVSARTFADGSLYTASKHAQRAFTRALQMEVAGDGVRVTEVRPGVVATHFADGRPRPAGTDALSPDDVADTIVFALTRPDRMRLDEIHFHPHGQTPEF